MCSEDLRRRALVPCTVRRGLYWSRWIVHLTFSCAISHWMRDRLSWSVICRNRACAVILRCWVSYTHARSLGDTHGDICSLLPLFLEPEARRCTRFRSDRPSRLFQETLDGTRPALIRLCIFGLTRVYNKLPQHIVDGEFCNEFQHHFNVYAKERCRAGALERRMIYSPGRELYGHL